MNNYNNIQYLGNNNYNNDRNSYYSGFSNNSILTLNTINTNNSSNYNYINKEHINANLTNNFNQNYRSQKIRNNSRNSLNNYNNNSQYQYLNNNIHNNYKNSNNFNNNNIYSASREDINFINQINNNREEYNNNNNKNDRINEKQIGNEKLSIVISNFINNISNNLYENIKSNILKKNFNFDISNNNNKTTSIEDNNESSSILENICFKELEESISNLINNTNIQSSNLLTFSNMLKTVDKKIDSFDSVLEEKINNIKYDFDLNIHNITNYIKNKAKNIDDIYIKILNIIEKLNNHEFNDSIINNKCNSYYTYKNIYNNESCEDNNNFNTIDILNQIKKINNSLSTITNLNNTCSIYTENIETFKNVEFLITKFSDNIKDSVCNYKENIQKDLYKVLEDKELLYNNKLNMLIYDNIESIYKNIAQSLLKYANNNSYKNILIINKECSLSFNIYKNKKSLIKENIINNTKTKKQHNYKSIENNNNLKPRITTTTNSSYLNKLNKENTIKQTININNNYFILQNKNKITNKKNKRKNLFIESDSD